MSADEKPTVEFTAAPDWAVKMTERFLAEFGKTNANISIVSNDLGVVKDRLIIVEDWKRSQESASRPPPLTSERVHAVAEEHASQVSMESEAQLAQERAAREELAAKVDALALGHAALDSKQDMQLAILGRLDKVASNPLVKTVAAMLATALVTWLASHGVHVPQ